MTSKIGNQCLNAAALLWKQSSKLDPSDPETTAAFVKYHLAEHLIFRGGPKSTKFHGLLTQAGEHILHAWYEATKKVKIAGKPYAKGQLTHIIQSPDASASSPIFTLTKVADKLTVQVELNVPALLAAAQQQGQQTDSSALPAPSEVSQAEREVLDCAAHLMVDIVFPQLSPIQQDLLRLAPQYSANSGGLSPDENELPDGLAALGVNSDSEAEDSDSGEESTPDSWSQHHAHAAVLAAKYHLKRQAYHELITQGTLDKSGRYSMFTIKLGAVLSSACKQEWQLVRAALGAKCLHHVLKDEEAPGSILHGLVSFGTTKNTERPVYLNTHLLEKAATKVAVDAVESGAAENDAREAANSHDGHQAEQTYRNRGLLALGPKALKLETNRQNKKQRDFAQTLATSMVLWAGLGRPGSGFAAAHVGQPLTCSHIQPEGLIKAIAAHHLASTERGPLDLEHAAMASAVGAVFTARAPEIWARVQPLPGKQSKMQGLFANQAEPVFITSTLADNILVQLDASPLIPVAASILSVYAAGGYVPPPAAGTSHPGASSAANTAHPGPQFMPSAEPAAPPAAPNLEQLAAETLRLRGATCVAVCSTYDGEGMISRAQRLVGLAVAMGGVLFRASLVDPGELVLMTPAASAEAAVMTVAGLLQWQMPQGGSVVSLAVQECGPTGVLSFMTMPPSPDLQLTLNIPKAFATALNEAFAHEDLEKFEKEQLVSLMQPNPPEALAYLAGGAPQCLEQGLQELGTHSLVPLLLDAPTAWTEFAERVLGPLPGQAPSNPAATSQPGGTQNSNLGSSSPARKPHPSSKPAHVTKHVQGPPAASAPPAGPTAEFLDTNEERMALITAAFAIWPPAAGPETCVKLAVALGILTPPSKVSRSMNLYLHMAARRFVSKAACFARTKLPGVRWFDHSLMPSAKDAAMHPEVQAIIQADPFFFISGDNAHGHRPYDHDVRLLTSKLAAAAVELMRDGASGAHAFQPLVWPPQIAPGQAPTLPINTAHYQAQEYLRQLMDVLSPPGSAQPFFQSCLAHLERCAKGTPPPAARSALSAALKLARADADARPSNWEASLQYAAATAAASDVGKTAGGSAAAAGAGGAAHAGASRSSDPAPAGALPLDVPLQAAWQTVVSDKDGAALVAACLTVWPWPSANYGAFPKLAVAIAVVTQPKSIILANKGRHRAMWDFALKAAGRALLNAPPQQAHHPQVTPAHKLPSVDAILSSDSALIAREGAFILLQLPRIAAIVCAAAAAAAESAESGSVPPPGAMQTTLPWPPSTAGMQGWVQFLHMQSQTVAGAVVAILNAGGPLRDQLVSMCLQRLSTMAVSVPHDQAQALMRAAAAAAGVLPASAYVPSQSPLGSLGLGGSDPSRRTRGGNAKLGKEEAAAAQAAQQQALRAAKAQLQAQIKGGRGGAAGVSFFAPTQARTARPMLGPRPEVGFPSSPASTSQPPSRARSQVFNPMGGADAQGSDPFAASFASTPREGRDAAITGGAGPQAGAGGAGAGAAPALIHEPKELKKCVTSADAYMALLAAAGIDNSDDEDFEGGQGQAGDEEQQGVVFYKGEDGVTMFAVCGDGAATLAGGHHAKR